MIVSVAAYLTAVGFIAWIAGSVLDMPGVATVGAVMIVGVGAMITTGGLEIQTGATEVTESDSTANTTNTSQNTSTTNESTNSTTTIEHVREPIDTPGTFSIGVVFMLLGAAMTLRSLERIG